MLMNPSNLSTKDFIRETAIKLFQAHGFENVTMMQICKEAGVTKRTFYYHFKSKNDVLSDITDYLGIKAERLLTTMVNHTKYIETLWQLMSVYCTDCQEYGPNIIKQVYILTLQSEEQKNFPYDTYLYEISLQLIKNAQNENEIENHLKPDDITFSLYHALRSVSITWAAQDGKFDLVEEFRKMFQIILNIHD